MVEGPIGSQDDSMLGGLLGQIGALERLLAESKPRKRGRRKTAKPAPKGFKYDGAPWVGEWIARGPRFKRGEQVAILERAKVDIECRNRVLWAYARQAFSEVRKSSHPADEHIEISFDDLFQEAMLGLIDAVSHFDYKGASFGVYSKFWIRQRVLQALGTQHLVRVPLNRLKDMRDTNRVAYTADQKLGRTAMLSELEENDQTSGDLLHALSTGPRGVRVVSIEEAAEQGMNAVWSTDVRNRTMVPKRYWGRAVFSWSVLDASASIDVKFTRLATCGRVIDSLGRSGRIAWCDLHGVAETYTDLKPTDHTMLVQGQFEPYFTHRTPEDEYSEEEFALLVQTWLVEHLDSREHQIVTEYFGMNGSEESTLEEIGDRLGLTRERVRQLRNRALDKLRRRALRDRVCDHLSYLTEVREDACV
jgi:RNA polymerase sigma factor (sigma-70 family)